MKGKKVVGLFGAVPPAGEPDAEVVAKAKEIYQMARSGKISGFGYFLIEGARAIGTGWRGRADRHDMLAGAGILQHRIARSIVDDE